MRGGGEEIWTPGFLCASKDGLTAVRSCVCVGRCKLSRAQLGVLMTGHPGRVVGQQRVVGNRVHPHRGPIERTGANKKLAERDGVTSKE